MATKLSLQERDYYQAAAKIKVVRCMWFNGNVRTLPRIRSYRHTLSVEAVAKTAACLLPHFVAFWEKHQRLHELCQKKLVSELFSAFYKGWLDTAVGFKLPYGAVIWFIGILLNRQAGREQQLLGMIKISTYQQHRSHRICQGWQDDPGSSSPC